MTLIINVTTPEGIVMASDSRQSQRNIKQYTRISTNSAKKLFALTDKVIVGILVIGVVGYITDRLFAFVIDKALKGSENNGWN
mgnify:CR=1 FL=1